MVYRLGQRAESDLEDIGIYTVDRWGFDQWMTYLNMLTDAFQTLERFPQMGKTLPGTQQNVRSYIVQAYDSLHDRAGWLRHDRPRAVRSENALVLLIKTIPFANARRGPM